MFCPACGIESVEQLKYCRNCGTGLNLPADSAKPAPIPFRLMLLFLLIAITGFTGMAGVLMTGFDLARSHVPIDHMMPVLILGTFITLGTVGALSWLLARLSKSHRPADPPHAVKRVSIARAHASLPAGDPDPASSVVEHTTRSFDPAQKKRPATPSMV